MFFFKQKTAYEMRISDWSSDVCSSDLGQSVHFRSRNDRAFRYGARHIRAAPWYDCARSATSPTSHAHHERYGHGRHGSWFNGWNGPWCHVRDGSWCYGRRCECGGSRSEEHTSELQSLMRISYAVFCLKKKNTSHA